MCLTSYLSKVRKVEMSTEAKLGPRTSGHHIFRLLYETFLMSLKQKVEFEKLKLTKNKTKLVLNVTD